MVRESFAWASDEGVRIRRHYHTATRIGRRIFVFGGLTQNDSPATSDLLIVRFDEAAASDRVLLEREPVGSGIGCFQVHGRPPRPRCHHGAANVTGSLVVFGGMTSPGRSPCNDIFVLRLFNNTGVWSECQQSEESGWGPLQISEFAMYAHGGRIYVYGGRDPLGFPTADMYSARLKVVQDEKLRSTIANEVASESEKAPE